MWSRRHHEQHKSDNNGSTAVSSGRHYIPLLKPVPRYYNPDVTSPRREDSNGTQHAEKSGHRTDMIKHLSACAAQKAKAPTNNLRRRQQLEPPITIPLSASPIRSSKILSLLSFPETETTAQPGVFSAGHHQKQRRTHNSTTELDTGARSSSSSSSSREARACSRSG